MTRSNEIYLMYEIFLHSFYTNYVQKDSNKESKGCGAN